MPKMKTHKGAASRFRVTGGGKIMLLQGDAESLLDASQEFHLSQAVKTEITVQGTVPRGPERFSLAGTPFVPQRPDHRQEEGGGITALLCARKLLRLRHQDSRSLLDRPESLDKLRCTVLIL